MGIRYILLIAFTAIFFSGCSSKVLHVEKPLSEITSDKSKAYVAFAYNLKLFGPIPDAILYEFNPKTFEETKALIDFDENGVFIQQVAPGKHYYIIRRVMPALSIQEDVKYQFTVDAKKGKITYVDLQMLKVFTPQRKRLEEKLQTMSCISINLQQFGFTRIEEHDKADKNSIIPRQENKSINPIKEYESSWLGGMKITCENNKVVKLSHSDSFLNRQLLTFAEMKNLQIIKPKETLTSYKPLEKEDIEKKYHVFHIVYKDALQKYPFEIYSYPKQEQINQYKCIQTGISFPAKISTEDRSDISKIINNKFSICNSSASSTTNKLKIIFHIDNYTSGSRAGRYFSMSFDNMFESMSTIQISVDFIDAVTEQTIGKIKVTKVLGGGLFGGSSSGPIEDAVNLIYDYTKAVYLKKD